MAKRIWRFYCSTCGERSSRLFSDPRCARETLTAARHLLHHGVLGVIPERYRLEQIELLTFLHKHEEHRLWIAWIEHDPRFGQREVCLLSPDPVGPPSVDDVVAASVDAESRLPVPETVVKYSGG